MSPSTETPRGTPLTVLAVDDERPALDELAYLLGRNDHIGHVHTAQDATTALRLLRAHTIEAVFLDINMPGLDGLELAGVLSEFAQRPAIVFVTAHDDRAVAAFDLGAVDYLLKPIREERLAESVRRVVEARATVPTPAAAQSPEQDEVIPVDLGGVTTMVARSSIGWVEAEGDYARLHTSGGAHLVRIPLSTLAERWSDAGFLRVHRSYLVAMGLVTGIRSVGSGVAVSLRANGESPAVELPVSRRHTRDLKDRLVRAPRQRGTP
ncbi:LytR/AlgR family response regulator transcription factor [Aldersonia kunmingensis]|uniref:LytR/AlgR family response regulator transcription factor n=1 Tax=Aldersonia kunmingensis TaxID=408066 RepID=UPI00082A1BB7|nr:LytTR family DNA-binding domain-containing protein [Aldersonia kunmingensis]